MNFQVLKKYVEFSILFSVAGLLLVRCAGKEVSKEDPDGLFAEAESVYKDERYLIAIEKFRDIKNRFPYSSRALDAELRIADCYFAQESYIESESAYEVFRELHPNHPKSDYVQYQMAMSFYQQIPSNSTRDLTAAYKAIEAFNVLLERFPKSEYAGKARESALEASRRIAEYESYVADFYFQRKHYISASYRYNALLQDFPNSGFEEEALFRLGVSYSNVRMFENAKDSFRRLIAKYPSSSYRSDSEGFLKNLTKEESSPQK